MAKLYYKIELRIAKCDARESIGDKLHLKGTFFYYSDGYLIQNNEKAEGYLTYDLFTGIFLKDGFLVQINVFHPNKEQEDIAFSQIIEIENQPGNYLLLEKSMQNQFFAVITFIQEEQDPLIQEKIEKTLLEVKKMHQSIP